MFAQLPTTIQEQAVRDLFSLLGDAPASDVKLQSNASRLLRQHIAHISAGDVEPGASIPSKDSNVACLGTLEELECGAVHAWGHFIAAPRAHAAAFAIFTPTDGVPRVYMATAWLA